MCEGFFFTKKEEIIQKKKYLSKYLNEEVHDIYYNESENIFYFKNVRYYVFTKLESILELRKVIKNNLWRFNSNFLSNFVDGKISAKVFEKMQELGEEANDVIFELIDRYNEFNVLFIAKAISNDKDRGSYLASYDGKEIELKGHICNFYAYRQK